MKHLPLHQQTNLALYKKGYILANSSRQQKPVIVFSLFGNMYSTNTNRKGKKTYSFDDRGWNKINGGLIEKLIIWADFSNCVKLIHCKKSLLAGI